MPSTNVIKSVINEYGIEWALNRTLYSGKLKLMSTIPASDKIFEKKVSFPQELDIFKIDVKTLRNFIKTKLSDEDKERLLTTADKAAEGVITGFNSVELDYGNPIDWQLNPMTGRRCNESIKWYMISDFDKDRGDIKVTWEASRFSHFVIFARAYLLTEDKKYYDVFRSQLQDWLKNNQYGFGANFKCGQECSIRMVNALLAYTIFNECGLTEIDIIDDLKILVNRCYRRVLNNFFYAHRCIKNNHTISELMGMIVGAWCSRDEKRLSYAYKTLDEVIDEQFTDDGGYTQYSFNYQRLALQDLEVIMSIKDATTRNLNERSVEKIRKAAELMYQCQDESGDMPNYGSNDGALIFPVSSCGYRDYTPVINATYALTTGKQVYEEGLHQEELIWFSSGRKINDFGIKKKERTSRKFPDAGLFTMRNPGFWVMIVADDYKTRPAHMDQLHFDLWVNGTNVFCDAGTYSYASDEGKKLVQNQSHNTAVIDNMPQMNTRGPFMVLNWTGRKLRKTEKDVFDGIMVSQNGYTHRRCIINDGKGFIISDKVSVDAFIHFHTPCEVEIHGNVAEIVVDDKVICTIEGGGQAYKDETIRSLYYLRKDIATDIYFKTKADEELTTIIKIKEI